MGVRKPVRTTRTPRPAYNNTWVGAVSRCAHFLGYAPGKIESNAGKESSNGEVR